MLRLPGKMAIEADSMMYNFTSLSTVFQYDQDDGRMIMEKQL